MDDLSKPTVRLAPWFPRETWPAPRTWPPADSGEDGWEDLHDDTDNKNDGCGDGASDGGVGA